MKERIKVSKSDKTLKAIVLACYPEWAGRKLFVCAATDYDMANYWDGGSRDYAMAFNLTTKIASEPAYATTNPMNRVAHKTVQIPEGVVIVEHSYFCGKDSGVTIYVNPANLARFLPAPIAAPAIEG